jgi:ribosomal protein L40E
MQNENIISDIVFKHL